MTQRNWQAVVFAISLLVAGAAARTAGAATYSTEEFIKNKERWDGYVKLGSRLSVEGRCNSRSPKLIKFAKCDIPFRARNIEQFPDLSSANVAVEVEGVLVNENGRFEFLVDELKQLPSDEQQYRDKARDLGTRKSEGWFKLGDWVLARGTYYDDDELKKLSVEAYQRGIKIDRENLPKDKPQAYFNLAEKAAKYKLDASTGEEFVHEGCRIDWDASKKAKNTDFAKLLDRLVHRLPGALDAKNTAPAELEKRYLVTPLDVYRNSAPADRKRLHRALYNEVLLFSIERLGKPDGSNGFEIATKIDKNLPDKHPLAESYRDRELEFKLAHVGDATQQLAVALAKQLDERKHPDKARQAREKWLAERTKRVTRDDPEGMLFLAEQYEALIGDKETAVKLLLEAYEKRPESAEIAAALTRHGYTQKDGKWLTPTEAKGLPVDPLEAAMHEGRVVTGMTREQVERALGRPTVVTRIATANSVSEVWIYRDQQVNRVTVQFQRGSGRKSTTPRVVASY